MGCFTSFCSSCSADVDILLLLWFIKAGEEELIEFYEAEVSFYSASSTFAGESKDLVAENITYRKPGHS